MARQRDAAPPPESREELLKYLERLSGMELRSRDDVRHFVSSLSKREPAQDRWVQFWRTVKQATWLLLLAVAFLQYYFMDVMTQIGSLQEVTLQAPVSHHLQVRSRSPTPFRFG